ncbi:MAG: hypothetical protein HPY64_14815 [Anaerolineae bacterium]|nr:hypothetical protein [Anaerolineae bacterium]
MCVSVCYQKESRQANPADRAEATIRQLVAMLEEGRGDRVFIAAALARYASYHPLIEPLVRGLAANFNDEERTFVLSRLCQARANRRPAPPAGEEPQEEDTAPRVVHHWDADYARRVRGLPPETEERLPLEVRVDPELGRLAIGLNLAAELRIWLVLRHYFGVPGWTDRQTLYAALEAAGIRHSRRHFNRLLQQGADIFWGLSGDGRVWLRGYIRVVKTITRLGLSTNPNLLSTNYPGVRPVYLRLDDSLKVFKARLYAAWLAHRENPKIARATLCKLFACTRETLWGWEAILARIISVIPSYTQTAVDPREDDRIVDYLPAHAYAYLTRHNEVRIRWQSSNVYRVRLIRQHPHKGQSRKARVAAAKEVRAFRPAENRAGSCPERQLAFGRDHWEERRYFASVNDWARFLRRGRERGQAIEDLITPETPRYLFRGVDRNEHVLYELTLDGRPCTSANERISIRQECVWWRAERRYRLARWCGMGKVTTGKAG